MIEDEGELRSLYRAPGEAVQRKSIDHVDDGAAGFLAAATLAVLATVARPLVSRALARVLARRVDRSQGEPPAGPEAPSGDDDGPVPPAPTAPATHDPAPAAVVA